MEYTQAFNGQPSFGGPFTTVPGSTTAYPPQPSPSPQQQGHYDPNARFLQSSPSPFYPQQHYANGNGGMGGGVNGGLMHPQSQLHQRVALQQHQQQHQQQQQQQHQNQQNQQLSSSPYSHSHSHSSQPPFAQPLTSPANPQFAHSRQTASPLSASNHASPYANPPAAQQSPGLMPSNSQTPMNPPPSQPPTPHSMPAQAQTPLKAAPQSPLSPVAQAREKERISTLLEINNLLLGEVVELQTQGKAGHTGPSTPAEGGKPKQQPSNEYVDCMRRLQSNLSFLAQNAEKTHKPNTAIQPGPAIMTTPASPPQLVELYTKLQGLYPGWKGQTAQKGSPAPQRLGSTSSPAGSMSMQPPNTPGLQNHMQPPNSAGLPPHMHQQQFSNHQQMQ